MLNWLEASQGINGRSVFNSLNRAQVEAVIDILCLMMYADNRVSTLEEVEFKDVLLRLPWLQEQEPLVNGRINVSASKARYASSTEDRRVIADTAAKALDDDHIAESVFELAITMAHSDLVFHEREKDVLDVLAQSLGIDPSRAQELTSATAAAV